LIKLPKAPRYTVRIFVVAHEDDTTPLTGLPSLPGDERGLKNFEFGDVPCDGKNYRLDGIIDVTARAGGDADEANEATDQIRIRFRVTITDP
jgi:hypothetical protein